MSIDLEIVSVDEESWYFKVFNREPWIL